VAEPVPLGGPHPVSYFWLMEVDIMQLIWKAVYAV